MLFRSLRVNLTGVFHMTSAILPGMAARGRGRVINVASTAGLTGYSYVAAYVAAKHGVVGLTRALALEYAGRGVTVTRSSGQLYLRANDSFAPDFRLLHETSTSIVASSRRTRFPISMSVDVRHERCAELRA